MAKERCTVNFKGRVQGVGFRMNAAAAARVYPALTGWVRNESDGSVQIVVEGERREVQACLDNLRQRMQRNLTSENAAWSDATGEYSTFSMAY